MADCLRHQGLCPATTIARVVIFPTALAVCSMAAWTAQAQTGRSNDKQEPALAGKWLNPSRGNCVHHGALFSGKATTKTATRGRLWRLTGQGYEEFIQGLNVKFRLRC